jgi:hypothetical protein
MCAAAEAARRGGTSGRDPGDTYAQQSSRSRAGAGEEWKEQWGGYQGGRSDVSSGSRSGGVVEFAAHSRVADAAIAERDSKPRSRGASCRMHVRH